MKTSYGDFWKAYTRKDTASRAMSPYQIEKLLAQLSRVVRDLEALKGSGCGGECDA